MKLFRSLRFSAAMALITAFASVNVALAQESAKDTDFTTSITYQNVGDDNATVIFQFRNQNQSDSTDVTRTLPAGAGDSLFLGSLTGDEALDAGFLGSAVMSADQPIVATVVQVPNSTTVKNRPLSNGFKNASPTITFATVLKELFSTKTNTIFSVQNATTENADFRISIFNADSPNDPPIIIEDTNVPGGAAIHYDMQTLPEITAATFNGSAVVEATVSGSTTPANIVGAASELADNGVQAKAFEAVAGGANRLFMASALCNVFGGQETAYAVTNTSLTDEAQVTVTYSSGAVDTATIAPGTKRSFTGCAVNNAGFSGAAEITSVGAPIAVVGKKFIVGTVFETAFNGELQGYEDLALPYVRWTSDANFNNGTGARQRAFIAISNVGDSDVSNVRVEYRDKSGAILGTHTIASIPAGDKANSTPIDATPTSAGDAAKLLEFGTPDANDGGGFGGSVIIDGPAGAQLVAIASITSKTDVQVQEDYNAIPLD